jgi:hypothetical protein
MVWTRRDGSQIRWPVSQTTRSPEWKTSYRGTVQTTRHDRTLTSLFDFVAIQGVRTFDRTEYAAGVLAFMRARSDTTSPF